MNFIIDAQLPPSISAIFKKHGFDSIHTSELPGKNLTPDKTIRKISIDQKRIVITKDTDFFHSYLLRKEPYKVEFVTTGNLRLQELKQLFEANFNKLIDAIRENGMIELSRDGVIIIH